MHLAIALPSSALGIRSLADKLHRQAVAGRGERTNRTTQSQAKNYEWDQSWRWRRQDDRQSNSAGAFAHFRSPKTQTHTLNNNNCTTSSRQCPCQFYVVVLRWTRSFCSHGGWVTRLLSVSPFSLGSNDRSAHPN